MKKIQINSSLSTNILPNFKNVKTIEIGDSPIAEGAFGEVYICQSVNGQPSPVPQVIKLFKEDKNNKQDHNFNTVQRLQNKIDVKNQQLVASKGKSITEEYPGLKGIPQFSFIGTLNGKKYRGFSSTNLKEIGFHEFIDILNEDKLYKEYQIISIDKKMLIAFHLASAFKVLQETFFIHADLKPEAIFINTKTNECAIIDFDSGTITENADDTPNTWGAHNDWVAPEIWEQLKQIDSGGVQKVKVNLLSDLWSVAVGIHYILTTTHPLFFLNELSPKVTKEYFKKYKWPYIQEKELYFNKRNKNSYEPIKNWLNTTLPQQIYNELYNTINFGYANPIKRTTYNQWEKTLSSVQEAPKINIFSADVKKVLSGNGTTLTWDITNAADTFINNSIGSVKAKDSIYIRPTHTTVYIIIAKNTFGTTEHQITIEVAPLPIIIEFKPKHDKIEFGKETSLVWKVENIKEAVLHYDGKIETIPFKDEIIVNPLNHTDYILIATALDGITTIEQKVTVHVFKRIEIRNFTSDYLFVVDSVPVTFNWNIENADEIILVDNFGKTTDITYKTQQQEYIKEDTIFRLRCKNDLFDEISEKLIITTVQNKYDLELRNIVPILSDIIPNAEKIINIEPSFIPNLDYEEILHIKTIDCSISVELSEGNIDVEIVEKINKTSKIKAIVDKIKSYIQK